MAEKAPLFSVICCAQADRTTIEGRHAALRAQGFQDFEFIVAADEKGGPGDRLLSALCKSRGEYIAICPDQGEFLPGALAFAAAELAGHADVGGLCGSGFLMDENGAVALPADIVSILLRGHRLWLAAGVLRRQALVDCGLGRDDWPTDALGLELWARIATDFGVRSVDRALVSSPHPQEESIAPAESIEGAIGARLAIVAKHFGADGFFNGSNAALLLESQINHLSGLRAELQSYGGANAEVTLTAALEDLVQQLRTLLISDHRVLRTLHRLSLHRTHALGPVGPLLHRFLAVLENMQGNFPIHAGYTLWNFPLLGPWFTHRMLVRGGQAARDAAPVEGAAMFANIHAVAGDIYDARGQIAPALEMWGRAQPPRDMTIDSLASQAQLKLPGLSEHDIAIRQRDLMAPHLRHLRPPLPPRPKGANRKIRIGYHCAFMNLATIRSIMHNAIAVHDRDRFEVYGYSPQIFVPGRTPAFDVFRHVPPLNEWVGDPPDKDGRRYDDGDFIDLVRKDEIDILVEMTGFSPGNRFIAMNNRCAPVQVNYLNHLASCQIPNIDYVLTDEVAMPVSDGGDQYYSEKVYRLSGCFLCYDYTDQDEPPVVDPPALKRGFVTFGYFGSGAKLNLELVELWSRLLHRMPEAKFHIQNLQLSSADNRRYVADRFARFGITQDRLVIGGGLDRPALMRLYGEVDISLDTIPYCGGNTVCESLWQGVPVVSLRGNTFIGTYGASLLKAAGCDEFIADTPDEYIEIALSLARDPARLLSLRHNLRLISMKAGLSDSVAFARRLEAAYIDMYDQIGN